MSPNDLAPARDLVAFIDASPTPYHAVAEAIRRLRAHGFAEFDERDAWKVDPGDRRYVIKAGGTLVAFVAGADAPDAAGFIIVGAHTDSPNFRVKPAPDSTSSGALQLGVEVYGGVLYSTWLDRDLSVAGRVTVADGSSHLVDLAKPICRMPNLAIHLNREVNKSGLVLNAQKHLVPILEMTGDAEGRGILSLVAQALQVERDAIRGFDLCVYDVQRGAIGGTNDDFVFSARLDNLGSCHAAVEALIASGAAGSATRVVALYDHEEIGSQSQAGAKSRFLASVLARIARARGGSDQAEDRAYARSLLVSADMAHAIHPNYSDKHDAEHSPKIGGGPVIKVNANQSYATDGPAAAVFDGACRVAGATTQRFVARNDMPCGSTIGPISAAQMGMRTVDVGNPMWSMHSCRETCGTRDVPVMIAALTQIFTAAQVPGPSV